MKRAFLTAAFGLVACALCDCGRSTAPPLAGGREVAWWVNAVHAPDPQLRRQAVLKLGNVGDADPAAAPALAEALLDTDAQVRRDAVFAVVKLKTPGEQIVSRLGDMGRADVEPDNRTLATRALQKIQSPH